MQGVTERREEERGRIFHPLFHSPDDNNSQSGASLKPEAWSFIRVSHVGSVVQRYSTLFSCLPGQQQGDGQTQIGPYMGC